MCSSGVSKRGIVQITTLSTMVYTLHTSRWQAGKGVVDAKRKFRDAHAHTMSSNLSQQCGIVLVSGDLRRTTIHSKLKLTTGRGEFAQYIVKPESIVCLYDNI